MMSEDEVKMLFEESKRIRVRHPNDQYWAGYVFALKDVLELKTTDM